MIKSLYKIYLLIIVVAFLLQPNGNYLSSQTEIPDYPGNFDDNLRIAQSLENVVNSDGQKWYEIVPGCLCVEPDLLDSAWDRSDINPWRQYYHPGAESEYRSEENATFTSVGGDITILPGQQCIYVSDRLITGGSAAGTPDRFPAGTSGHTEQDVVPFEVLGWRIYSRYYPPNNGILGSCPGNPLTLITVSASQPTSEGVFQDVLRLPDAHAGIPYEENDVRIVANGGTNQYEFSVEATLPASLTVVQRGMLPPGLSIDTRTGRISGVPEILASEVSRPEDLVFMFTVFAEDDDGKTGSQAFEIVVHRRLEIVENPEPEDVEIPNKALDLIFVIDTTGSMEDDIAEVRANALRILDRVAASGADWRISIVTYRDHPQAPYGDPGDYPSRVELNFSSDYGEITGAINGIRIGGGADFQESVYSGLHTAISQSWRPGVRKVIILMGDAPPHNPEPITGYTHNSVLQAAYDADPVSIYPIQIADDSDTRFAFQSLADGSSGRLFTARTADDVVDTLVYTVTSITEIPQLALELTPGSLAEVMTDPSSILPLRQDPTSASSVLEDLRAGSRVTVLAGPEYADGYLWWNIESATGTRGWSVEAVGGIQTLIPLTDTRPVPFRDHFYDNRAGWEISLTGNAVTSLIRDGLYTIVAAVTDQFEYWIVAPGFENWSLAPIFDEPYEVEFRVLDVQASSGGYGLAILFDVQQGYKPHKRLFLNSDGTWQLFRWTGVRELLGEGVLEGGPINLADRRSHVIKLRVETDQYTVFVDDNQVLQIPSVDPILGTVGFGVAKGPAITGDRITIRFDDLVVRSLVED